MDSVQLARKHNRSSFYIILVPCYINNNIIKFIAFFVQLCYNIIQ